MPPASGDGAHRMRAILTYHSIDPSGSPVSVHPDAFARHVAWLISGRVTVTTPDRLLQLPDTTDAVAVTFDDAFENFAGVAAPALIRHALPVTLFVVTDHVGATNAWCGVVRPGIPTLPLLDWAALASLQAAGVTLGAHTRTHPDLTALDAGSVVQEVRGAADIIEERTGSRPGIFAYPYGRVDDATATIVGAEFEYACTTEYRVLSPESDRTQLPRLDMFYFQRPGALDAWGSPGFEQRLGLRRSLRRLKQWFN